MAMLYSSTSLITVISCECGDKFLGIEMSKLSLPFFSRPESIFQRCYYGSCPCAKWYHFWCLIWLKNWPWRTERRAVDKWRFRSVLQCHCRLLSPSNLSLVQPFRHVIHACDIQSLVLRSIFNHRMQLTQISEQAAVGQADFKFMTIAVSVSA